MVAMATNAMNWKYDHMIIIICNLYIVILDNISLQILQIVHFVFAWVLQKDKDLEVKR